LVSVVTPVYRDAERAIALVDALLRQRLPQGTGMEIIVVDDGSGDDTGDRLETSVGGKATVLRLPKNTGRSVARNAGAAMASGEQILFLDCDCMPANDDLIAEHLHAWDKATAATTGPVEGIGRGFWHRYQSSASARRAKQHASGANFAGSSQNLMVSRSGFERCGGFDAAYRAYGFEDRDLLLRMERLGHVGWAPGAIVRHMDAIDLPTVCRKMAEAGRETAPLFRARHLQAYRHLGYAAIDAVLHPWLRVVAIAAGPVALRIAPRLDAWLDRRWLPYPMGSALVKIVGSLCFLYGTSRPGSEA